LLPKPQIGHEEPFNQTMHKISTAVVFKTFTPYIYLCLATLCSAIPSFAFSQQTTKEEAIQKSDDNIAYELTNPLSNLQLFSLQWNHNRGLGANQGGTSQTYQMSPKIKVDINQDWNFFSRVYVNASKIQNVNGVNNSGIGPTQIETFFSPKTDGKLVYGLGPYLQIPGGQSGEFGPTQWGAGIRGVFVAMPKPWTIAVYAHQSWSVGGSTGAGTPASPGTGTVNTLSAWPTVSYTTDNAWVYSLDSESVYNYDVRRMYVPVNALVSKVVRIEGAPISFGVGARYNVSSYPGTLQYPGTPRGWGARLQINFVLGK